MATPICLIAGAWDFASYGTSSFTFTDSGGSHSPAAFSTGTYEHGTPPGIVGDSGVSGYTAFGPALQTAMQAVAGGGRTITVTYSFGKYTIAIDSGTFSLNFSGSGTPGTLMRRLLGFTGDKSGSTSYTSDAYPWFVIKPSIAGLTNYIPPSRAEGSTKEAVTASGQVYRLAPTSVPRLAMWEHRFEPKERVDRDYHNTVASASSTHLYDWEQLWDDYGQATLPLGIYIRDTNGNYEEMSFVLAQADYGRSVIKRNQPNDDQRFTVFVQARLWPGSTANKFGRSFNA